MKKRVAIMGLLIVGLLAGCGTAKTTTPASTNTAAQENPAYQTVIANEQAAGKSAGYTLTGVQLDQGVLVVQIKGVKDGEVFKRVGSALGAVGSKSILGVKGVAVEYVVGSTPYAAVEVPFPDLQQFLTKKITQQQFSKDMKVGLASSSTTSKK